MSERSGHKASLKGIHGVGLGAVAEWTMSGAVGSLVLPIYTTGFGLSPVLVGWAVSIPRLFDAVIDPVIGNWSDQTRSRWGRRKPFLLAGALLGAFFTMAIWWTGTKWSPPVQFAYLLGASLCFWFSFATYTIPSNALSYELSLDYHDRVRVFSVRSIYCTVPGLLVGWVYWLALRPIFGGEIPGIRWVSGLVAAVVLLTGLAPLVMTQERFAHRPAAKKPLGRALVEAIRNPYFRYLAILSALMMLGNAVYTGLVFYVNVYQVCAGDKALATRLIGITTTLASLVGILLVLFLPKLGARIGKKNGLLLGAICVLLHAAVQPLIFTPAQPWLQLVNIALFGPATVIFGTFSGACLPDICDIDELETGLRREALYGSVLLFIRKVELSLTGLLAGLFLTLAHFDGTLVHQTAATIARLRLYSFGPYLVCAAVLVLLTWRFPLTPEMMTRVRQTLDLRNQSPPCP